MINCGPPAAVKTHRAFPGLFLLLLLLVPCRVQAQRQAAAPWWLTLEEGKRFFRGGSYGDALRAFEEAREVRKDRYARMRRQLVDLLSIPEVRSLGDSLDDVEAYIAERKRLEAAAALTELYYRVPRASLGGSAARALAELERLRDYPEAEYWIGEVYRLEGELGIALGQYKKALALRELLEVPEFETELRYKIAQLHHLRREYPEMEQALLEIIEGPGPGGGPRDYLWTGDGRSLAKTAMMRTLESGGVRRFLSIYRYTNPPVERAHRLLGNFQYATGRHLPAAEHLMFAFLIQTSAMIDEVLRSRFDYTFTTLDDLVRESARRPALTAYMADTEYHRTVYYLAASLYASGKGGPARELWTFLAAQPAAGQWKNRAELQLQKPFVERAVENP